MPEADPAAPDARSRRDLRRDLAWILLAGLAVCGPRLCAKSLWSPDEARYAEVAREMRVSGDLLVPRVYGEPETSYPPLYYWLIVLFSLPAGRVTALTATLPSFVAALGLGLTTYGIGRVLWDRRSGFLSALILTSFAGFVGPAILCRADMTLALFESAALFLFIRWYRVRETATFPLAFYVAVAAGTLAKGPQAVVIVAGIVLLFLAVRHDLRLASRLRLGPGLALLLALTLPWFVWARLKTGQDYLLGESLSGFAGTLVPGGHGRRSALIYIGVIAARAFPWILFLPPALIVLRREERAGGSKGTVAFLASWILAVFVFYSLAASKRHYYVTAVYPALALVLGRFWSLGPEGWRACPLAMKTSLAGLGLLAAVSELYLDFGAGRIGSFEMAPFAPGLHVLHGTLLLIAALGLVLTIRGSRETLLLPGIGLLVAAGQLGAMLLYEIPQQRRDEEDGRRFVDTLRRRILPGEHVYLFREDVPSVPLHLDQDCRILRDPEEVRAKVDAGEPFVVGVKEWRLPEISAVPRPLKVAFRESIPAGGAVLIFLRPDRGR
jgi:hypothetical protein